MPLDGERRVCSAYLTAVAVRHLQQRQSAAMRRHRYAGRASSLALAAAFFPEITFAMRRGVLLGFACYAAYAISDAFVKSLRGAVPAFEVVFFGAVFGLLALPLIKARSDRWREMVVVRCPGAWWVRAISSTICNVAAVIAFTRLPMAETFALIFLMPIFVTVLSVVWLHEHVGWRRWLAVFIGFAGVLVVLRPGFRELGSGHVAALVCGLAGAVSVTALRVAGRHEKRIALYGAGVLGPLAIGGTLMLPDVIWPTMDSALLLAGYGLFAALAGVLLMLATRRIPVNRVAPTQYSQMLWAIGFGYWLFGDHLDWPMLVGIALILCTGSFTLVRDRQLATTSTAKPD